MAKKWSPDEIKKFLATTNPNVRKLFRELSKVKKAKITDLKVPVPSVAIAMRVFKIMKKNSLYKSERSEPGQPPLYSIEPAYRKTISSFLSKFKEPRGNPGSKKKAGRKKVRRKKPGRKKGSRKKVVRKKAGRKKAGRKKVVKRKVAKRKVTKKKVVKRKRRGRPKAKSTTVAKRKDYSFPVTSLGDLRFWADFVDYVNNAKGKKMVMTTDGRKVNLKIM